MKKPLFISFSLLLIWQSYKLVHSIVEIAISSWFWLIFTAWVINMFITGIFAISGFVLPTQKLLPASYYRVSRPERLSWWHRTLRVDLFRKFLLATLWRSRRQRKDYFNGTRQGLDHLLEVSQKSEFGHLIPFFILMGVSIYLAAHQRVALGIATALINVLGNLYPVLLQRHHRMRIGRLRSAVISRQ